MKYPFSVLFLSLSLLPGSTPPAWIAARRFGSGSHLPASLGCPTERGSCTHSRPAAMAATTQRLRWRTRVSGTHRRLLAPQTLAASGCRHGRAATSHREGGAGESGVSTLEKALAPFPQPSPAAELVNRDEHGGGRSAPGYDRPASRCVR